MNNGKKCTEVRPLEVTLFSERSRCSAVSAEYVANGFMTMASKTLSRSRLLVSGKHTRDTEQASITEWHGPHGVAQTSKEGYSRIVLL